MKSPFVHRMVNCSELRAVNCGPLKLLATCSYGAATARRWTPVGESAWLKILQFKKAVVVLSFEECGLLIASRQGWPTRASATAAVFDYGDWRERQHDSEGPGPGSTTSASLCTPGKSTSD